MTHSKTLNIEEWARKTAKNHISDIKSYIDNGWDKEDAIKKVLDSSTIGTPWKSQIRYEIKYYNTQTEIAMPIKLQDPETKEIIEILVNSLHQATEMARRLGQLLIVPDPKKDPVDDIIDRYCDHSVGK